jgi:hypothetical protein
MLRFLIAVLLGLAVTLTGSAASLRVTLEVGYETGLFSDKPNDETRRRILPMVKQEIFKNYLDRADSSTVTLVERNRDEINRRLDDIVTNIEFLDEQVLKDTRRLRITVRATVNDNIVSAVLAASGPKVASGQGSAFGFLILPRLQSDAKSFDATVTKNATSTTKLVTERVLADQVKESDGGASERNIEGNKVTMSASAKTSGATTRKSQQSKWRLGNSKNVNASVVKYLSEAGYEPSSYDDIASDPECAATVKLRDVQQDFLTSETAEISGEVRFGVFSAARKCDYKFFAIGTMDIDSIEQDRGSGGVRVRVAVNIQVHDIKRPRNPVVVSVGPVFFDGLDRQEEGAIDQALLKSAKEASQVIVNQLRTKGLQ